MQSKFVGRSLALACLASTSAAQVPDGWYVFGTFSPSAGRTGLFLAHPRVPGQPIVIDHVQGDLSGTGSSCVLYRESDGAILAGERAPAGGSVDLHMIQLSGSSVLFDASFSLGRGGPCCGEVPQMALLPDGRVVVAVTDVDAGPLQNILTTGYGWQGVGIVDTRSGLVTSIPITNGAIIVDVFNALALSLAADKVYLGTYVSGTRGDIWEVPLGGGTATLVTSVPAGLSNMAVDVSGDLYVTTLDALQPLYRVNVSTGSVTPVPQANGALNAIALEDATGNFALASASVGLPRRSIFWMDPSGNASLLSSPGFGTPSGIAASRNPRVVGHGTSGNATYSWRMPNPGGLPTVGNATFSVLLDGSGASQAGWLAVSPATSAPFTYFGAEIFLDLAQLAFVLPIPAPPTLIPLGLPSEVGLAGISLYFQSVHPESTTRLAASPALKVTIL